MTYSEKLQDPRWQKKRLEILTRDDCTCQCRGDKKTMLHIHHKEYASFEPWETPNEDLVAICKDCHRFIEALKKEGVTIDTCVKTTDIDKKLVCMLAKHTIKGIEHIICISYFKGVEMSNAIIPAFAIKKLFKNENTVS